MRGDMRIMMYFAIIFVMALSISGCAVVHSSMVSTETVPVNGVQDSNEDASFLSKVEKTAFTPVPTWWPLGKTAWYFTFGH